MILEILVTTGKNLISKLKTLLYTKYMFEVVLSIYWNTRYVFFKLVYN